MADGIYPSLVSATRDANAATNPIFVQLTDGAAVLTTTGGSLDVNITGGSGSTEYAVDAVAGGSDLGTLALVVRDDALTTLTPADGDYTQLRVTDKGALWVAVDGSVAVTIGATVNVDIQDSWAGLTGGGTEAGALRVTIANDSTGVLSVDDNGGSLTVDANDLDIRNLNLTDDAVKVSGNSSANSIINPIFVQVVKTAVQSQEIHNYSVATPAGDAASNHDYTVTGTTFLLTSVIVSCSGAMKAEIQTGPVGSLATKAVVFLNARQGDTKQVFFDPPIEVPVTSTGTVRVIRTNRNSAATDVYSTIIGNDVA